MQSELPVLIRSLHSAAPYPHPVSAIELVETHISWVLLTGSYAYKIKKPVDLGFLDFTTLERRRHYCEEELRLNRRFAAALYLDLVPITGSPEAPRLDDGGETFEYAVKMVQFEPTARFDRLLAAGRLSAELLERLAQVLAEFHAGAARAAPGDGYGSPEAILRPARENFAQIELPAAFTGERAALVELKQWSERAYQRLAPRFAQRQSAGFVRECHGDLHLANVTLHEGRPTPFDCLEFDPQLRWIDVMSEIAFLIMDLDAHGRGDLALRFLNEYLHHSGDYEGLDVLRYYGVYRAMVRAKIESIRLRQQKADSAAAYDPLLGYLKLARAYTSAAPGAVLIAHGLSGSGKTTLSRHLLAPCGLVRVRSDVERKRLAGYRPDERTRSPIGGGVYTQTAGERTYRRLEELATAIVTAGFPALVDATFLQRAQRDAFRALAARLQVPFLILDFRAEETLLRERLHGRKAGSDASEADLAVLARQLLTQEPLAEDELDATMAIDAAGEPDFPALAAAIRARINAPPAAG